MKTLQQRQQFTQQMIDAYQRPKELLAFDEAEQRWIAVERRRIEYNPEVASLAALWFFLGVMVGLFVAALVLK